MKEKVVRALKISELQKSEIENLLEVPKDINLGDYAFPCFSLSKKLKKNPNEIAQELVKKIKYKEFEKVQAVGPYINFFLNKEEFAKEIIEKISKEKDKYGSSPKKRGLKRLIEFSQPNTHKAFHVGHIRGTSVGESLARLFEFSGDEVIRINYSGDTGMHIAKWIWCYLKYHKKDEIRNDESWIAGIYVDAVKRLAKNPEFQEEVDEINRKLEARNDKTLNILWDKTRKLSIKSWDKIYSELNTHFDVHYFESEVEVEGKKIAQELVKKQIAKISDEAVIMDLKDYGLSVWVLLRKDGTVLYSSKDLALAEKKAEEFKFDKSLIITGSEQDLHFMQLRKTLELMKFKNAENYEHASYGLIRLPHGKMSSRTGDNVIYSEFKKELVNYAVKQIEKRFKLESIEVYDRALAIAIASMKYSMLKQEMNKNIIFDKKEALRFEGDTGPYLLYSYARARSILRKANFKRQKKFEIGEVQEAEKKLVSEMNKFPEIVEKAYRNIAPNVLANYAFSLAQVFSEFYHEVQVIGSENEQFRLELVDCFSQVMKNALWLLAIPVIEEM